MSTTCPACAQPASGRFCSHCGAAVSAAATCRECSASLPPGARFCNMCGAGVNAPAGAPVAVPAARASTSPVPWVVAAVAVVALLGVVVVASRFGAQPEPAAALAPNAAGGAGPQAVDLSSMTPRDAADRLFDRIMRSASAGDSAEARRFVPMALGAYERVEELDADAHYHLGVLHLLAGDATAARAEADVILAADPNHLFGLFTAAQAAEQLGEGAEARALFQRFLDLYPSEITRDLPEYSAHSPALPEMRSEAQQYVR